jgi:hypothetical protein
VILQGILGEEHLAVGVEEQDRVCAQPETLAVPRGRGHGRGGEQGHEDDGEGNGSAHCSEF